MPYWVKSAHGSCNFALLYSAMLKVPINLYFVWYSKRVRQSKSFRLGVELAKILLSKVLQIRKQKCYN